jgi:hypothetical protein
MRDEKRIGLFGGFKSRWKDDEEMGLTWIICEGTDCIQLN